MTDPLSRLAIEHGTDKFGYHDYTPNYHKLFRHLKDEPIKVLEIGVGGYADEDRGGQSLAMWRDYFVNASIVGIDIRAKTMDLGERVTIKQGSQIDPDFLDLLVAEHGPFDIIIDDGSHQNAHVVESYGLLWPALNPGGIYVAEDVQTAFIPRFGGSLTMDAPNSVGFFSDLICRMNYKSKDPLLKGLVGMERFHNMVALHKSDRKPVGYSASNVFEAWDGKTPKMLHVETNAMAHQFGMDQEHDLSKLTKGGKADRDIVIIGAHAASADSIRAAFARLKPTGLIVVDGAFESDAAFFPDLAQRFVEVDHVEITTQFPDTPVDEMAANLYAIERHVDGLIFVKAPNEYPSNFAFDFEQPQAAKAIAAMEKQLATSTSENGLTQMATIATAASGRDGARIWLNKLEDIGATSRVYFQLAVGLARHDRDLERSTELLRQALGHFPLDSIFTQNLGAILITQDRASEAEAPVVAAIEAAPRDSNLRLLLARIADKMGDLDTAIAQTKIATEITKGPRLTQAQGAYGEYLIAAGRHAEAEAPLQEAAQAEDRFGAKAQRLLSEVLQQRGDTEAALLAAEKALELSPQTREYQLWHEGLAS